MTTTAPLFMDATLPTSRPGFDPAGLQVGSTVVVVDRPSWKRTEVYAGTVTKKARIWIEVKRADGNGFPREWRLRLDDQTDGTKSSTYGASFRTPEQHRYHQAYEEAAKYLVDQGLRVELSSPWNGRTIELARLLWAGQKKAQMEALGHILR